MYSSQYLKAPASPQISEKSSKLPKSPQLFSDRGKDDSNSLIFYSDPQTCVPTEPIYYYVQDGCGPSVPLSHGQCGACVQVGGQSPAHCSASSTFQVVSNLECCVPKNKTSLSPCHNQNIQPFYGEAGQTNSRKRQSFPDVLQPTNQLINYYV